MSVAAHRIRYAKNRSEAFAAASANMSAALNLQVSLSQWNDAAREALAEWGEDTFFKWDEIFRRHNDIDKLDMAIWVHPNRLAALGLATTSGSAVVFRFLEGDPRPDCPLRGARIAIALEAVAMYAQARGKSEIRLKPLNEDLVELYLDVYGFELISPKGEEPYCRREV